MHTQHNRSKIDQLSRKSRLTAAQAIRRRTPILFEALESRQMMSVDPTGLSVTLHAQTFGDPTQETVSWNPSGTGASTFNIYRSTTAFSRGPLLTSVTAGTGGSQSYADSISTSATSTDMNPPIYFYTVTSVSGGVESAGGRQAYVPQMIYNEGGNNDSTGDSVQSAYESLGVEVHYYADVAPPAPSSLPTYGPLVLAGFSFGGDDSVNTARNAGRTVDYMALIDPVPHTWPVQGNPNVPGSFTLSSNVTYADDFYDDNKTEDPVPSGPIVGTPVNYLNRIVHGASHGAIVWDYTNVQSFVVAKINALTWNLPMATGSAPAAPSNVVVTTASNTALTITWADNSSNETSFLVQRSTTLNGTYTNAGSVGANTTTFSDTGLGVSVTYYYKVSAVNAAGPSAPAIGVGETSVPNAPWGLTVGSATNSTLNLSWFYNTLNNTSIVVARGTSASGPFTPIATLAPNALSYNDSGLTAGTTYYYQVSAVNAVGSGTTSGSGATTSSGSAPLAPTNLVLTTLSNTSIGLAWSDNANNETSYIVQRSATQNGTYSTIVTLAANSVSYTDSGLGVSVVYFYHVYASNSVGPSGFIAGESQTSVPNSPWGLSIGSATASTLNLSWFNNSVNNTSMVVARSTSSSGPFTPIATLAPTALAYNDSGLAAGTTYYYQVSAVNAVGSGTTSGSGATTSAAPAAPSNFNLRTASNSGINLSWSDNANNETSYIIQRSTTLNGTYSTIVTLAANSISYSDTGLSLSANYYYKLYANNASGNSAVVSGSSATSVPNGPYGLAVSANSSSSLHLSWFDTALNETNFVVTRSTSLNGTYSIVATLSANITTWDDSGLSSNTTYYYKVYATNDVGNSGTTNASGTTNP